MIIEKLYSDIDGVIVDMNAGFYSVFGMLPPKDTKEYYRLTRSKEGFWENLPWRADALEYWRFVRKVCKERDAELFILTAPPKDNMDPAFEAGRKKWIMKNLGPQYVDKTIIEYDKYKYADKHSVLIDDRERNVNPWREAGGIAFLYNGFEQFFKEFTSKNLDI